ncbi:hypothetical protein ALP53_200019 [Pseudomonas savastanoi pv. phaseolicola]|nr:hypothetical protein ALP53_200019 [Pseudomonas savastanoi pv. phaseolicola]
MHSLLVVFGNKELKPFTEQHQIRVLISGLRSLTNIGMNILDIRGRKNNVPVPVTMTRPGIKKVHGTVSSLGCIHTFRVVVALNPFVCPLLGEQGLGLIEDHKGVSRHPMEPSSNSLHTFLGLVIDV